MSDRLRQQFRCQFRVRRSCVKQWLDWLKAQHPGYRDIVVSEERLAALPNDGDVLQDTIVQEVDAVQVGDEDMDTLADHWMTSSMVLCQISYSTIQKLQHLRLN